MALRVGRRAFLKMGASAPLMTLVDVQASVFYPPNQDALVGQVVLSGTIVRSGLEFRRQSREAFAAGLEPAFAQLREAFLREHDKTIRKETRRL
jgi:hypothetical protein